MSLENGRPGTKSDDQRLHASGKIRQRDDPAAPARQFRHQLDDLAQGVDLGAAEFVSLPTACTAMQRAQQRIDHIVDKHRLQSARLALPEERSGESRPADRAKRFKKESPGPNITDGRKMVQSRAGVCSRISFSASPLVRK